MTLSYYLRDIGVFSFLNYVSARSYSDVVRGRYPPVFGAVSTKGI